MSDQKNTISNHGILECYNDDDVISFKNQNGNIYKISKLRESFIKTFDANLGKIIIDKIVQMLGSDIPISRHTDLFDGKQNCEILQINSKGWKTGKLKLTFTVEFIPDVDPNKDPHSLDDIRQSINQQKIII